MDSSTPSELEMKRRSRSIPGASGGIPQDLSDGHTSHLVKTFPACAGATEPIGALFPARVMYYEASAIAIQLICVLQTLSRH